MTATHAEATRQHAATKSGSAVDALLAIADAHDKRDDELARFHEVCEAVDVAVVGPSGAGEVAGL